MGHGYITVLGYGIDLFLDQFVEEEIEPFWKMLQEVTADVMEDQGETENVFITTKRAIWDDARGACGRHTIVDFSKLQEGYDDLQEFVSDYFPTMPIQLTFYSYED